MSAPHVVVIGGGLAGMAAALACADGGAAVTLMEGKRRLGGATYSFARKGMVIDNGQHVFLRCCTAYRWFLDRVGASELVTIQPRLAIPVVAPGGRTGWLWRSELPAPFHLGPAIARFPFLSPRERLLVAVAAQRLARLDRADPAIDECSFADWLLENGQSPRAIRAVWDLIILPALNVPSSQASLALAAMVFQTGLLSDPAAGDIGYPLVPLSVLHGDHAAKSLRKAGVKIRLGTRVTVIEAAAHTIAAVSAAGGRIEADAAIVAVPHEDAAGLLPPGAVADPGRLLELGNSPIVNVHVVYDRTVMDWPFAAGLETPVQWVFDRTRIAGVERGQYLAVSLSGADEYADAGVKELRKSFLPALAGLFPRARDAEVLAFFVTREHAATFRQSPGTAKKRPGPITGLPNLFLAGAWTDTGWPATMEGAVRSGLAAAREAMIRLGHSRPLPKDAGA